MLIPECVVLGVLFNRQTLGGLGFARLGFVIFKGVFNPKPGTGNVLLSGMSKTFEHFPLPLMTILCFSKIEKIGFLFNQKCSKIFDATQHLRKNQNGHQGESGNA